VLISAHITGLNIKPVIDQFSTIIAISIKIRANDKSSKQ